MNKYTGFYIEKPTGNNIFSYEDRENKKIYVPKLIEGTLDDVSVGEEIVFNEIDEDIEIKAKGLKNMVIYKYKDKDIYIQYFKTNPVGNLYERLGFIPNGETKYHYQMYKAKEQTKNLKK